MIKYNPYLKMKYNPSKNEIVITPKDLIMWLNTFRYCSLEAANNIEKTINFLTTPLANK